MERTPISLSAQITITSHMAVAEHQFAIAIKCIFVEK